MSDPKDNEEYWENFDFPTRPLVAFDQKEGDDDEGEASSGESGGGPNLKPARRGKWMYAAKERVVYSTDLHKKISLLELDQSSKVLRLLSVLNEKTDYDIDSLVDALEEAALDCYGQELNDVLSEHRWGTKLLWPNLNAGLDTDFSLEKTNPNQDPTRNNMGLK